MEQDSIKGTKFNLSMIRENAGGSRSAVVEIKLAADSIDAGDADFTHLIDEELTLDLLRAARTWVEAHCAGLTAPYDLDNFLMSQSYAERLDIDPDTL